MKNKGLNRYAHSPAHLFIDNSPYFITAAIYQKMPLLEHPDVKDFLIDTIKNVFAKYNWELHHWVILNNHYHLMGKSRKGKDLSQIIRAVHSFSSAEIRKAHKYEQRVWWNYWDYCPRSEKDYKSHVNYLFYNPIRHRLVEKLQEYPFSSFHDLFSEIGREGLLKRFGDVIHKDATASCCTPMTRGVCVCMKRSNSKLLHSRGSGYER